MTWKPTEDLLIFDLRGIALLVKELQPTKRSILSVATRFYDPLGFVSPVTVRFKMLFQELCVSKIGWDEPLSGDLLSKWKTIASTFQGVTISLPRCYFSLPSGRSSVYSLRGFCDAATGAYAAVVYMMGKAGDEMFTRFVAAKTRVSPVGKQTIPRLELLSALLLAKLITTVRAALELEITVSEMTCYTDSKVAMYWIKGSDKEWKPFVQNRLMRSEDFYQPDVGGIVQGKRIQPICHPVVLHLLNCLRVNCGYMDLTGQMMQTQTLKRRS